MQIRLRSLAIIFLAYLGATFTYYSRYVQGDFAIYFAAGKRISSDLVLYESQSNLYVYGPLLAHLLSGVAQFNEIQVSQAWLLLSIVAINLSAFLICRIFVEHSHFEQYLITMIILNIGFAARNNLGNGNVMAFVLLAVVLSLYLILKKVGTLSSLLVAALTLFVFEVKTYLALFIILYYVFLRSYKVLMYLLGLMCVLNLIYVSVSDTSYLYWIQSLINRSNGLERGSDQATFLFFLNSMTKETNVITWTLVMIVYLALLAFLFWTLLAKSHSKQEQGLILIAAAPVITVFAHGQDFILSTLVLAVLALRYQAVKKTQNCSAIYFTIAMGLLINWTNEQVIPAIMIHLLLATVLAVTGMDRRIAIPIVVLNAISTFALSTFLNKPGDLQYLAYNFQALFFGVFTFLLVARFRSNQVRLEG